jgi:hypothetical protein
MRRAGAPPPFIENTVSLLSSPLLSSPLRLFLPLATIRAFIDPQEKA